MAEREASPLREGHNTPINCCSRDRNDTTVQEGLLRMNEQSLNYSRELKKKSRNNRAASSGNFEEEHQASTSLYIVLVSKPAT